MSKSDYAFEGDHLDDDDEPCNCGDMECVTKGTLKGNVIVCPSCKAEDKYSLVCGDHGMKCGVCGTRFTCP